MCTIHCADAKQGTDLSDEDEIKSPHNTEAEAAAGKEDSAWVKESDSASPSGGGPTGDPYSSHSRHARFCILFISPCIASASQGAPGQFGGNAEQISAFHLAFK